jgi:tetratricopeptide (TPR) repeat protein
MQVLAHLLRGQALLANDGNERLAIDEFASVARIAADHQGGITDLQAAVALVRQAQLYTQLDEDDAAREALGRAQEFADRLEDAGALPALIALARAPLLMRALDVDRALEELASADRHLERLPGKLRAAFEYVRGELLRVRGDEELALATFCRAADLDATEPRLLRSLAAVQTNLGDHDAAVATIDRAWEHASDDSQRADLARLQAVALRRAGRLEAALERARQALARDVDDARSWLALGDAYQALDRLGPGATAYRRGWGRSGDDQRTAARALVGLTNVLIRSGDSRAALDVLDSPHTRERVARLARTYGAVSFNRAVALLQGGNEQGAIRALKAAAAAEHPAPQAADLAGQMMTRRSRDSSWLGFWFSDSDGGAVRRLVGTALLVLLTVTALATLADPGAVAWLGWVSPDGNHRLVPLLAIAALFLLPIVTKLKLGSVEIEQPQPAPADVPELQPTAPDDIVADMTAVAAKATEQLAGQGATKGRPVGDETPRFDRANPVS